MTIALEQKQGLIAGDGLLPVIMAQQAKENDPSYCPLLCPPETKKDIEGAIDKIIDSFEGLLDKFYQEKELDIATDISAMEVLMKQDGLTE